jgi:hypothetical protein
MVIIYDASKSKTYSDEKTILEKDIYESMKNRELVMTISTIIIIIITIVVTIFITVYLKSNIESCLV